MKKVFISSFHPFISRNILSTTIIDMLVAGGVEVVLVVPEYKQVFFQENFARENKVMVVGVPVNRPSASKRGLFLKRIFQMMLATNSVKIHFNKEILSTKHIFYRLLFYCSNYAGKWRVVVAIVRYLDFVLSPRHFFSEMIDAHKPDLIFTTDIQNENDIALMQDGRRKHIPIVSMVRSWDNLTYLSLIRMVPEKMLVASDVMSEEARIYHFIPKEKIVVVGVPHRDAYRAGTTTTREEFFRKIHADPARPLLFYAPVGDLNLPDNTTDRCVLDVLATLAMNIFVRFPPADTVSNLADFVPSSNMYINRPGYQAKEGDRGRSELTREDDRFLIDGIYHCDVVINGPSTISIDAALFNKPVIQINFQVTKNGKQHGTILNYEYDNLKYLTMRGGVRMATSQDELVELIAFYLNDPQQDHDGRRRIVRDLTGPEDACASKRVVDAIQSML